MSRCGYIKGNGERCQGTATGSNGLCWNHDPVNADRRRRAASKAGKSRVGGDVKDLREQLQNLTERVITGALETGRGAVANQLITTQIKLLEYERKSKDLDELIERLERLEHGRLAG